MLDTLTVPRGEDDFNTVAGNRPEPGGFLPEARTGAREAAAHMKDLAERFAELRNAIMPSCACPATRPATTAPGSATSFSISNTP